MTKLGMKGLAARARRIRVALMDIDGVLTNGVIYHFVDVRGGLVEFKGVHAQDSIALTWLAQSGIRTGVISGRRSRGMERRLKLLKASFIYQGRLDKEAVFDEIRRKAGVQDSEVLYLGDDLPDLPVMRRSGLSVAPRNARPEVRAAAHWVTRSEGGNGAVRETAEVLLRAQGLWEAVLRRFVDRPGALR